MESISAIIVAYEPQVDVLRNNVNRLLAQVSHVIIVDNTESSYLLDIINEHVVLICNNKNLGVAAALNIGCHEAIKMGYKWAVTFDQDSVPSFNYIHNLRTGLPLDLGGIGVIGPAYTSFNSYIGEQGKVIETDSVITSGCIMNLIAFNKIGGFMDELFIDMVDIEYCWRLRQNNYRVLMNGNAVLEHKLGNLMVTRSIMGKVYQYADHSPLRTYYYTRNLLWVTNKYKNSMPHEYRLFRRDLKKEIFKITFISSKKVEKLLYALVGFVHYFTNRLGEF